MISKISFVIYSENNDCRNIVFRAIYMCSERGFFLWITYSAFTEHFVYVEEKENSLPKLFLLTYPHNLLNKRMRK